MLIKRFGQKSEKEILFDDFVQMCISTKVYLNCVNIILCMGEELYGWGLTTDSHRVFIAAVVVVDDGVQK